jgi:glycosyltransferase involved in cell wall biosynthesis
MPDLVRSCSAAVAVDEETYKEAVFGGVPREKIVRIPSGLVFETVPSMETVQSIPTEGVILYVGRMVASKRLDSLIKAYSICQEKSMDAMFPRLDLIGGGDRTLLERIARQVGVIKDVYFHGLQSSPEPFLPKAICFVNPSESEGFPNAVLEACAFGVPVILSDIPVHRIIASEIEMEYFLFPVGNEKVLAEKLLNFLNLSREEVIRKRIRCAQYGQRFSKEVRNQAYLDLYKRIFGNSKTRHEMDK